MNWHTRIAEAEIRERFTSKDKSLAHKWRTCAVGELHPKAKPVEKLEDLGCKFFSAVYLDKVEQAKKIYAQIQGVQT